MLEIVHAIKNGSESAFEQAFLASRNKVYLYFLKKTGGEEDARDLLQNTFLRLWQYRQSLNPAYSLDQQIFHIAKTVNIDFLRKQQLPLHNGITEHDAVAGISSFQHMPGNFPKRASEGKISSARVNSFQGHWHAVWQPDESTVTK